MFTIETFTEAHLSSVTNRTEAHGDDRVPAVSISLEMTCANTMVLRFRCGTADVDAERPRRTEMEAQTDAGASPVQREVRPTAWYDSESGTTDHGPWKPMRKPSNQGAEWLPLYDQAALDAAVAAERERCASIANEQTLAWGEGAGPWNDACLLIVKLIRET